MNWLKPVIASLLVALWVPLTSHCDLEGLPGFEFLACADQAESQPHSDNDCTTDACAVVESGLYKVEDQSSPLPAPLLCVMLVAPFAAGELSSAAHGFGLNSPAPPELARIWQFSFRTALPPRAPSFAS